MHASKAWVTAAAIADALGACRFDQDHVFPGYYGPLTGGVAAAAGGPAAGADAAAGSPAPLQLPAAGRAAPPAAVGGSYAPPTSQLTGMPAPAASAPAPVPVGACDLSGRWLSTWHYTTDGLGALQTIRNYIYYEIAQQADAFTVVRGLQCGNDAESGGDFAVKVDMRASWATTMQKTSFTGRRGTSAKAASGCMLTLEKWYTVQGATVPYYQNPSMPLPSAEQKASGATPGWEDWDNDGQPGVTSHIQGTVSGKVFSAARMWNALSGSVPDVTTAFELPIQWNQEANVIGFDGSPLLGSEVVRAADPKLHFVQFARLRAEDLPADDAGICSKVLALSPSLTPRAAGL